jgi:hypothetical protein
MAKANINDIKKKLAGTNVSQFSGSPLANALRTGSGPISRGGADNGPSKQPIQKGNVEAGNAFIRAREKAEALGASRKDANAIAFNQTKDIGLDKFNPETLASRQELEKRQVEESQQLDALTTPTPPLSTLERNVEAGRAFGKSLGSNIGLGSDVGQPNDAIDRAVFAAIGVVSTTGIAGVSISTLFSPASGNVKNLQGDINENVVESTRITRAALSKGANLQQAISSTKKLEDSIRFKYAAAEQSLKESPKDIREGLDLADDMSRDLRIAVENRQVLERYALTGDPTEALLLLGTVEPMLEEQNI